MFDIHPVTNSTVRWLSRFSRTMLHCIMVLDHIHQVAQGQHALCCSSPPAHAVSFCIDTEKSSDKFCAMPAQINLTVQIEWVIDTHGSMEIEKRAIWFDIRLIMCQRGDGTLSIRAIAPKLPVIPRSQRGVLKLLKFWFQIPDQLLPSYRPA